MKKFLSFLLVFMLSTLLIACGNDASESTAPASESETVEVEEPKAVAKARDLPEGDYAELGEGTVYIATAGGTSENGNVPVIYAAKDLILTHIGLTTWDFNGGALSFVYIDGMLTSKEQLGDAQVSIELQGELLAVGIHTVEVVQYENDDPASAMTAYRVMQYEIKAA